MFVAVEHRPDGRLGLARVALDRGEYRSAADHAEQYLRQVGDEAKTRRVAALEVQVRALAALRDADGAQHAGDELALIAADVDTEPLRASALAAEGVTAAAADDLPRARRALEDAVTLYARSDACRMSAPSRASSPPKFSPHWDATTRPPERPRERPRRSSSCASSRNHRRPKIGTARVDWSRTRGACSCRGRSRRPSHRAAARDQRAHGPPPCLEHPGQALPAPRERPPSNARPRRARSDQRWPDPATRVAGRGWPLHPMPDNDHRQMLCVWKAHPIRKPDRPLRTTQAGRHGHHGAGQQDGSWRRKATPCAAPHAQAHLMPGATQDEPRAPSPPLAQAQNVTRLRTS